MLTSIKARIALLRRLEKPRDYGLFLRILGLALIAPWLMKLQLARVARLLTPRPLFPPDQRRIDQIIAYTNAVLRTGRPLVQDRCLTRGLTLYYFLRQNGLPVELQFGVGYADQAFAGHCWLLKDGEPFAEAGDPRVLFTPIYKFPLAATPNPLGHQSFT